MYWADNPYELYASITPQGSVNIYIPESNLHLVTQDYQEICGCMRKPTYSSRLFRDLQFSFRTLLKQQNDVNLGIEWERIEKNNPQLGTLPALIQPFCHLSLITKVTKMNIDIFIH